MMLRRNTFADDVKSKRDYVAIPLMDRIIAEKKN
jgi:hypothetical protein